MTDPLVRPAFGWPWTIEEIQRLPDDGCKYELVDGSLLVSPMPAKPHWRATYRLANLLRTQAPDDFIVSGENPGIIMAHGRTYRIPDISVLRAAAMHGDQLGFQPADVAIAIEILSPSNAGDDLVMKRYQYGKAGIPHYWVVDPKRRRLSLLVHDGAEDYLENAVVEPGQRWETKDPFPITLDPADFLD